MTWQHRLTAELTRRTAELGAVQGLRVFGSVAAGEVDRWSDLDVAVELSQDLALPELVPGFDVWAYEEQRDEQQVLRLIGADGRRLDLVVSGGSVVGLPSVDAEVNQIRFRLALATVKLGRGDRLIGTHLALGVAGDVLVEAMLLRDADTGTRVHRSGTRRDAVASAVLEALRPPLEPHGLRSLAEWYDRLRGERDPDHRGDWRGLQALTG